MVYSMAALCVGAQESVEKKIKLLDPPPEFEKLESAHQYSVAASKAETVQEAEECMQQWIKTIEIVRIMKKSFVSSLYYATSNTLTENWCPHNC